MSYWAGVRGKNPMRYSGGLLGGSWLTALAGDLGGGKFDGAWLVQNFENLNPANTLWTKQYNLYAKVDTERALSRIRTLVGRPCQSQRRRNAVHRRRAVRRQQARAPGEFAPRTVRRSTCAPFARRSWCSAHRATTSRRRSRRWAGFSISTTASRISASYGQTIVYTMHEKSAILAFLFPAASPQGARGILQQYRPDRCASAGPL